MNRDPDSQEVAEAYIAYITGMWAQEYFTELVRSDAERAWAAVSLMVEKSPDAHALSLIATGPLEQFVLAHGEHFLEAITAESRRSPKMQKALGGVWGEQYMPKKVWNQIRKIAG